MARATYDKSPEELAREQIRYNDELRREQARRDMVNARVLHRNQALKAGIPESVLPSPSQIKTMSDADWNSSAERMSRYGFHGVDEQGRLLPPKNQSPLVAPARISPLPAAVTSKAPLNAFNDGTSSVARSLGYETKPTVSQSVKANGVLNAFSTTPADARAIAERYGSSDQGGGPKRQHTYTDAAGKDLGPMYDANGHVIPMPKGTVGLRGGESKAPTNAPITPALRQLETFPSVPTDPSANISLQSRPPQLNTDLTKSGPVFPVEPKPAVPPSTAQSIGARAGELARSGIRTLFTGPINAAVTAGKDVASSLNRNLVSPTLDALAGAAGGFVSGFTPRTATNASAAQFEKPTKENPVPVTPTTPNANIDRTDNSLANFGLSEDDITKRKLAFAGF
jgi:hypothetical protein